MPLLIGSVQPGTMAILSLVFSQVTTMGDLVPSNEYNRWRFAHGSQGGLLLIPDRG